MFIHKIRNWFFSLFFRSGGSNELIANQSSYSDQSVTLRSQRRLEERTLYRGLHGFFSTLTVIFQETILLRYG